jgi:hypothetical protein
MAEYSSTNRRAMAQRYGLDWWYDISLALFERFYIKR